MSGTDTVPRVWLCGEVGGVQLGGAVLYCCYQRKGRKGGGTSASLRMFGP